MPPGTAAPGAADTISGPEALRISGPEALRRALRGPPGRVALRVPLPGSGPAAARRRVALALLEEAGRPRGAAVLQTATGDLLLTEAAAPEAARTAALLQQLLGTATETLPLPQAMPALLALPGLVPAHALTPPTPAAAGIESLADAAPLGPLLRRDGVVHLSPGISRRIDLIRLRLTPTALAPHIGEAARDGDLARHARDRMRARLLAELASPLGRAALLGPVPPLPLLIDLPARLLPDPPPPGAEEEPPTPAIYASLSPAEAMAEGLAARHRALRHAGWGLALRGVDAATLALLAADTLPIDLILLRWSPALVGRGSAGALRRVNPARLVLTRCDGEESLKWGLGLGISRYAGPWIDALMAAERMAHCPSAAGCSRGQCAARGAAAAPEKRQGCQRPDLLGALLPVPRA